MSWMIVKGYLPDVKYIGPFDTEADAILCAEYNHFDSDWHTIELADPPAPKWKVSVPIWFTNVALEAKNWNDAEAQAAAEASRYIEILGNYIADGWTMQSALAHVTSPRDNRP